MENVERNKEGRSMCGRYTITVTMEELMLHYMIDGSAPPFHQPKYNVAPGQMVLAVIQDGSGRNRLGEIKWGLVPQWAKDEKIGYKLLNARAETLLEKPAYKIPFLQKRCLIPADGFYEWKKEQNGKRPMRIVRKDRAVFSMAGLYEIWTAQDGRRVASCTVITTEPNGLMAPIHDRMPVILRKEDESIWLDRGIRDPQILQRLLRPYDEKELEAYPVSSDVGQVKNDHPSCIEPIAR
jgi:putative SOS response-associated peptidase YedK